MRALKIHFLKKNRNVLVNHSYDKYNFLYALIRLLHEEEKEADYKYLQKKYFHKFKLGGLKWPLAPRDINKFLKANSFLNITINLVYLHRKSKYPWQRFGCGQNLLHLLLVKENQPSSLETLHHFYPITNFDRFIAGHRKDSSKESGQKIKKPKYHCFNCHWPLNSEEEREAHYSHCVNDQHPQLVKYPSPTEEGKAPTMKFKNFNRKFMTPVVGYADFESSLIQKTARQCKECVQELCVCDASCLIETHKHEPLSYCLIFVSFGEVIFERTYAGPQPVDNFLSTLHEVEEPIRQHISRYKLVMPQLTQEDWTHYIETTTCQICEKVISQDDPFCMDHDHCTGALIGKQNSSFLQKLINSIMMKTPFIFRQNPSKL